MNFGFGISEEDVETVLRRNAARVHNPTNKSLADLARELFDGINADAVEAAALENSCDLDEQTDHAHDEIERQLVEQGAILAQCASAPAAPARKARP
jgi:hypothetical protein